MSRNGAKKSDCVKTRNHSLGTSRRSSAAAPKAAALSCQRRAKASELITSWNYEWQDNSFEELGENEYDNGAPMNVLKRTSLRRFYTEAGPRRDNIGRRRRTDASVVSQSLSETIFAWSSGDGNQQETGENNNHVRSGNHMDEGRRSPGACDLFSAADRQGLRRRGGRVGQAEGHLAGRPHPRQLPGKAHPGAETQRRTCRTRRAGDQARGQHHQAAEHLGLDPAAQGRDQGTAGQGLRHPGLSRGRQDRGRARHQGALRQGARQRCQPGAARGQLRPPRRRRRQAVRPQPPAQDGRLEAGLEVARGAHDGRRFLRLGSFDHRRDRDQRADRARRGRRQGHRAEGQAGAQSRRGHRRRRDEPQGATRFHRRSDRRPPSKRACCSRCI